MSESNSVSQSGGLAALKQSCLVFFRPRETYGRLLQEAENPRLWIQPFIGLAILTTMLNVLVFNAPGIFETAKTEFIDAMRAGVETGKLTPEQAELAATSMEERLRPFFFIVVHGTRDIKDNAVWLAVVTLWFWAGSRFLFSGEFGYGRAAQLVGPAMSGLAIDAVLTGSYVLVSGELNASLSVGQLARAMGNELNPGFWDWIQPINLWLVYVLGVGLSAWGSAPIYKGVRFMALGWGALIIAALR